MFTLPEEILAGTEEYKKTLARLLKGEVSEARFKGVRVPWGIYSQRYGVKKNIYMARVRLPGGVATGAQIAALAEASRRYGKEILHVTDRQDIQIHNVQIEKTGALMDYLAGYNLSPRGGGGNTVRNITACPLSGICDDEVFDVGGYAIALTETMLRDESSYNLPRKYKIAFSACGRDCAHATVNDLGFIAKIKGDKRGFTVYSGGGMGASSRIGQVLEEFIPAQEAGNVAEAVKRVFDAHGNRRDKHHARLRYLVEKIGFEEFRKLYRAELKKLKDARDAPLQATSLPQPSQSGGKLSGGGDDKEFQTFKKHNIAEQRQKGFYTVEIRIPLGDTTADDLERLGLLETTFPDIEYRTSQRQNIVICNVPGKAVYQLYRKLREHNLARPYASTALDVVCCAGASRCNLGICDSKAMVSELIKELEGSLDAPAIEKLADVSINVNGCPNSCGQAPIGAVGVVGMTKRIEGRMAPYYKVSLGGRAGEGRTRFNEPVDSVPARATPAALRDFLLTASKKVGSYGSVHDYFRTDAVQDMKEVASRHANVPPYSVDPSFFRDWGKTEDFSLAGIGSAECGAGIMEIIEADLADAETSIKKAEEKLDAAAIKDAIHYAARALLVVKGIDSKTTEETFNGFVKELVEAGTCSPKFKDAKKAYDTLNAKSDAPEKKEKVSYAKELLADVKEAYKQMDNNFNFQKRYEPPSA